MTFFQLTITDDGILIAEQHPRLHTVNYTHSDEDPERCQQIMQEVKNVISDFEAIDPEPKHAVSEKDRKIQEYLDRSYKEWQYEQSVDLLDEWRDEALAEDLTNSEVKPIRTDEMQQNGQRWVLINNRWEIKATGAKVKPENQSALPDDVIEIQVKSNRPGRKFDPGHLNAIDLADANVSDDYLGD